MVSKWCELEFVHPQYASDSWFRLLISQEGGFKLKKDPFWMVAPLCGKLQHCWNNNSYVPKAFGCLFLIFVLTWVQILIGRVCLFKAGTFIWF